MTKTKIAFLGLLLSLCACKKNQALDKEAYLAYFKSQDNACIKAKEMGHVVYKMKMRLPEFSILDNDPDINEQAYYDELKAMNNERVFSLLIEDEAGSNLVKQLVFNRTAYGQMLEYVNAELIRHIKLVSNGKETECTLVHMEPANSVQPVIRLSLAFRNPDKELKECTVVFDDQLFNNGQIKFRYTEETLKNLPTLKF